MSETTTDVYVRRDEHGALRVADTRVPLDSIVAAFQQGHSPETMQQQYPALTLEQIDGALTYYLAHTDEVNDYLRGQERLWLEWQQRSEHAQAAVLQRLRAVRTTEKTTVG